MGKPLTIQEYDDAQIRKLQKKLGIKTKIDVVRRGLERRDVPWASQSRRNSAALTLNRRGP